MPRTNAQRQQAPPPPEQQELLERLVQAVERLEEEVRFLGETLARIEDEKGWEWKNDPRRQDLWLPTSPAMHITSMPRDPLAPDFGERINKVKGEALAALREQLPVSTEKQPKTSAPSGQLF